MKMENKMQTKFKIDQKVMTPVSDFPGVIESISIRRIEYNGYSNHRDIYNFYMVKIQVPLVGKPEFGSIITEYAESALMAA